MIYINNDTYVTSLFDSEKYMGTFMVNDKRIPSSYNGNEKLFTLLESAIQKEKSKRFSVEKALENLYGE